MDIGGPLILVGCGKMGGALLGRWLERGIAPEAVTVIEPRADLAARLIARGVAAVAEPGALAPDAAPAVVVLAVKPQQMDAALRGCSRFARPETVFLSIAAGTEIAYFEGHLGADTPIVRAMPNSPAAVGRGMTVLCANPRGRLFPVARLIPRAEQEAMGEQFAAIGTRRRTIAQWTREVERLERAIRR